MHALVMYVFYGIVHKAVFEFNIGLNHRRYLGSG
jgi:hypothetical protein